MFESLHSSYPLIFDQANRILRDLHRHNLQSVKPLTDSGCIKHTKFEKKSEKTRLLRLDDTDNKSC